MKKLFAKIFIFSFVFLAFAERPIVQDIQAVAGKNGKINISWVLPENPEPEIKSLLVYKSTVPITSSQQLTSITPVATLSPEITGYTDTVSDFSDYFYAVIAFTDAPYDVVLVSINSTLNGTHLAVQKKQEVEKAQEEEKLYPVGVAREMPLPYLDLAEGLSTDEDSISQKAVTTAKQLARPQSSSPKALSPYYFEEDLISPDSGDDYLLFDLLKNYFVQKDYEQSITQLNRLIARNINENTTARAVFYLGESLYFTQNYEEAVKMFVRVQNQYPLLTSKWIDSSLDFIK